MNQGLEDNPVVDIGDDHLYAGEVGSDARAGRLVLALFLVTGTEYARLVAAGVGYVSDGTRCPVVAFGERIFPRQHHSADDHDADADGRDGNQYAGARSLSRPPAVHRSKHLAVVCNDQRTGACHVRHLEEKEDPEESELFDTNQ